MSTQLEDAPAHIGSDHDEIVHVVCCDKRMCDGEFEVIDREFASPEEECVVCVEMERTSRCRVCLA